MAGKTLTDKQREELVQEYIDSHVKPDREPMTQTEIAAKYGVSQQTVSRLLRNDSTLEKIERRTRSNVILAQAILEAAAPEVARRTVQSAMKEREEKYEFITQGDRRDVLDRAGVRAQKEDKSEVTITFSGGPEIGMPESVDG